MIRLSEVTKLTGVTRRALQGYAAIGLLKPTQLSEAGYWLYDDEALSKLAMIQIFTEVGYSRNEIKKALEKIETEGDYDLSLLIKELERKKARIDGQISFIQMIMLQQSLPNADTLQTQSFESILARNYSSHSLKEIIDSMIKDASKSTVSERQEYLYCTALAQNLFIISLMQKNEYYSSQVQLSVRSAYEYASKIYESEICLDSPFPPIDLETLEFFKDLVHEILFGDDNRDFIQFFGKRENKLYIQKAVNYFCDQQVSKIQKGATNHATVSD